MRLVPATLDSSAVRCYRLGLDRRLLRRPGKPMYAGLTFRDTISDTWTSPLQLAVTSTKSASTTPTSSMSSSTPSTSATTVRSRISSSTSARIGREGSSKLWVVERHDGSEVAIHAMKMRARYEPLLRGSEVADD
jgi:hypothetical protein